jgi:hypothetical protein
VLIKSPTLISEITRVYSQVIMSNTIFENQLMCMLLVRIAWQHVHMDTVCYCVQCAYLDQHFVHELPSVEQQQLTMMSSPMGGRSLQARSVQVTDCNLQDMSLHPSDLRHVRPPAGSRRGLLRAGGSASAPRRRSTSPSQRLSHWTSRGWRRRRRRRSPGGAAART